MTRTIKYMPVDEIAPATINPKLHDAEAIAASIDRFGYVEPIVLDERTGRLVAGHGRLEGLAILWSQGFNPPEGIEDRDSRWYAPVIRGWSSANDVEAAALLLAVNQLVIAGGMDDQALGDMLQGLNDDIVSWEGIGFSDGELEDFLAGKPTKFKFVVTCETEADRHRVAALVRDAGAEARYL